MRVRTMHPSNARRSGLGAWQTNKKTNTTFSHLQPARVVRSPQTLHGDRGRRAHPKRCYPFLDLIHSFSARGQNVDFWLLSKNNTGRLPLCGNPAGKELAVLLFTNTTSQITSLTVSWLLVILNHWKNFEWFHAQVFVQIFECAEIARCQHCNADNFKIL